MSNRKRSKRFWNPSKRSWNPQPNGHTNPRRLGGDIIGPGGPNDFGGVVLDCADAILAESFEVAVVDKISADQPTGRDIYLVVDGRINKTRERARVGMMIGTDGAAALVTELLALADRAGPRLLKDITDRLTALDREGYGSIAWLRAALDVAEETRRRT
jgi:hypothetical protein